MDEHTEACLLAILAEKQMQRMLASEWHDCTMGEALEWLGKDFMRGHIRVKPQVMCELAGVQYPMPMQDAPAVGSTYWIASATGESEVFEWDNDAIDKDLLAARLLHTSQIAAEAHSKALRAVNAQAVAKAKEQA